MFDGHLTRPRLFVIVAFILLASLSLFWNLPLPSHLSLRSAHKHRPKWLVATMSPYSSFQRRAIIRSTWQDLYRNESTTEFRFVLCNPDPLWEHLVAQENATYGDLIILRHLEEESYMADRAKAVELLKYLVQEGKRWSFVSKLDDDNFLDGQAFYSERLAPLLSSSVEDLIEGIPRVERKVIGKTLRTTGKDFAYPSSHFYTLSWDIVEALVNTYLVHNITDEREDILIGELLNRSRMEYEMIELPYSEAFEIGWGETIEVDGKRTAWAGENVNFDSWRHPVGSGSINPYRMKDDDSYLMVAACYGPQGPKKPILDSEQ